MLVFRRIRIRTAGHANQRSFSKACQRLDGRGRRRDAAFPGTGDLFASVIAGALTREKPLDRAIAIATEYTRLAMLNTVNCATVPVYGVQLEQTLGTLISMIFD